MLKKSGLYGGKMDLRSRCPVRDDERFAVQLPCPANEADYECISQRVLCLARPAEVEANQEEMLSLTVEWRKVLEIQANIIAVHDHCCPR